MKRQFLVLVNFNGKEVIGIVKIRDYLKAIRSMRYSDSGKWLFVSVFSPYFDGYEKHICRFPVNKVQIYCPYI